MTDPRYDSFWIDEYKELAEIMSELGMDALLLGSAAGVQMLPESIASLIDWDVYNDSALAFLDFYRLNNVTSIHETTKNRVVKEIQKFITEGISMQDLLARLDAFTFSDARVRSIAVTEVTRLYAVGNQITWQSSGYVTGKKWQTAVDDMVCPYCSKLHNQIVEIDSFFSISEDDMTPEMRRRALTGTEMAWVTPPAHTNCRCYLIPFVDDTQIMKQIEGILDE
jgi:hypothetical protein